MQDAIIFHIDVNSAFLSWTALHRLEHGDPVDLRTIPAIVGRYFHQTWRGTGQIHPRQGLRYHYRRTGRECPAQVSPSRNGISGPQYVPHKKPAAHGTPVEYLPGHRAGQHR